MNEDMLADTMAEMAWPEIERQAKQNALVVLPVGVIEEHGVHLPLGTDIFLAVAQAKCVAEVLHGAGVPCLVAPPFYWGGLSAVTKNFPGSIAIQPAHITAVLTDILESLERAGFRRLLTTNVHGDGMHIRTIIRALKEYDRSHAMNARWLAYEQDVKMYGLTGREDFILPIRGISLAECASGQNRLTDAFDVHAGALETAWMREMYPELVDEAAAAAQNATMLHDEQIPQWMSGEAQYTALTPAGHVGDPAKSTLLQMHMKEIDRRTAEQVAAFYDKTAQEKSTSAAKEEPAE